MILTLLGGGGFRVPLVYAALLADHDPGRVLELRLYDSDRHRLDVIAQVLARQADTQQGRTGARDRVRVSVHTDLAQAVRGTDFIFSALRVGGLAGRVCDERVALELNTIGQETVGAGGISYALRTIPVAVRLAEQIRTNAPDAWVINFTNPAGRITETMARTLGERVIGICDSPVGLARRALVALGLTGRDLIGSDEVQIGYAGLNHLGWLHTLTVDGEDVLPRLIGDAAAVGSFEEGRLFGPDWLQTLGALPNEYLHYYYFAREALAADQRSTPRGAYLAEQQQRFYDLFDRPVADPLVAWERARMEREETYMANNRLASGDFERDPADLQSGGYDQVALAIMRAISRNAPARLILNVPNRALLPELDHEAIVEVPCLVDQHGARALPNTGLPDHGRGLVVSVKQVERYTIEAATTGSARAALLALAGHPLVDSVNIARRLLDGYRAEFRELDYLH
ncbi:MAG: 6-phospho-beta-glucosidase [Propionibacteriaceae bacterium]